METSWMIMMSLMMIVVVVIMIIMRGGRRHDVTQRIGKLKHGAGSESLFRW